MKDDYGFIIGLFLGILVGASCSILICRELTMKEEYEHGYRDAQIDAFHNGVAVPEIVDDKIIYRWLELHDLELPESDLPQ